MHPARRLPAAPDPNAPRTTRRNRR
jgi:hypothetical protein